MNALSTARQGVADSLVAAGLKAASYVAETVNPPIAVVVPDDPYVNDEDSLAVPFGHSTVNLSVLLIGGKGTNKAAAEQIDEMVCVAFSALRADTSWSVEAVSSPGQVNLNGHNYLGAVISIQRTMKLEASDG